MDNNLKAPVYLQVEPRYNTYYDRDDPRSLIGASVVGFTKSKSKKPRSGVVEIKLNIEIERSAFLPLRPEATIIVPASLTDPHPVEVEAFDANDLEN